jgi:hypothetical protein
MWFGSITPPEPTWIRSVSAATAAIRTGGEVAATAGMLWCSATQNRAYPRSSAAFAISTVPRSASPLVCPSLTVARSRTEIGTRGILRTYTRICRPFQRRRCWLRMFCTPIVTAPRATPGTAIQAGQK